MAGNVTARSQRRPRLARLIDLLTPWYDWGAFGILRVDGEGEGDGHYFAIDWLGLHVMFAAGRTPIKQEHRS